MKNSLRQLATSITIACKAKGTKQSVILNELVKNDGFRSIQTTDNITQKTKTTHDDVIYDLRTKLLNGYPDSDIYIDMDINNKQACLDYSPHNQCIITTLWNESSKGYIALLTLVANIEAGLQLLEILMVEHESVLCVNSAIALIPKELPIHIQDFVAIEFKQGSDGHKIIHSRLVELIERLTYEVSMVADHLRSITSVNTTTVKPSRVVTINVEAIDPNVQTEEDLLLKVEGSYRIELNASVPFDHIGNAALDTFHSIFSFQSQENYNIFVVDKNGDDIHPCPDVESYIYNNQGCII